MEDTNGSEVKIKKKRMSKKGKKAWKKIPVPEPKPKPKVPEGGNLFFIDTDAKRKRTVAQLTKPERKIYHKTKVLARDGAFVDNEKSFFQQKPIASITTTSSTRVQMQQLVTKIQNNPNTTQQKLRKSTLPYDLWTEEPETSPEDILPFITKVVSKKRKPSKPEPSSIPAVEIDLPGNSYNPSYEDHQDALGVAVAVAVDLDEKEEQIEQKLKPEKIEIPKIANGQERAERPAKKQKKLNPNFSLKKTTQERKKQKRQKEIERQHRIKRSEKRKMRDIDRLKQIKKSIAKREKILARRAELRQKRNEELLKQPRKLGKLKLEEEVPVVLTSDELPSRLLNLDPAKTNLLKERYRNLLKRNFIEPRVKQFKTRKYALKYVEKPSHKFR